MHTDDIWSQKINRLAQHTRFSLNTPNAPANHTNTVDHGRVRIGTDKRIWIVHPVFFQHPFGQVFEINLVNDANTGWNNLEAIKRLHAPFQELIACLIALKFLLHVLLQGIANSSIIDLYRMIDNEVHRHEWLNELWVFAQLGNCRTHRG